MELRPRSKAVSFSIQVYGDDAQDFKKLLDNMNKELKEKGESDAEYTPEDLFQHVFRTFVRQNSTFEQYLKEDKKGRSVTGGQARPPKAPRKKANSQDPTKSAETAAAEDEQTEGDKNVKASDLPKSGESAAVEGGGTKAGKNAKSSDRPKSERTDATE